MKERVPAPGVNVVSVAKFAAEMGPIENYANWASTPGSFFKTVLETGRGTCALSENLQTYMPVFFCTLFLFAIYSNADRVSLVLNFR